MLTRERVENGKILKTTIAAFDEREAEVKKLARLLEKSQRECAALSKELDTSKRQRDDLAKEVESVKRSRPSPATYLA